MSFPGFLPFFDACMAPVGYRAAEKGDLAVFVELHKDILCGMRVGEFEGGGYESSYLHCSGAPVVKNPAESVRSHAAKFVSVARSDPSPPRNGRWRFFV